MTFEGNPLSLESREPWLTSALENGSWPVLNLASSLAAYLCSGPVWVISKPPELIQSLDCIWKEPFHLGQ